MKKFITISLLCSSVFLSACATTNPNGSKQLAPNYPSGTVLPSDVYTINRPTQSMLTAQQQLQARQPYTGIRPGGGGRR
jgi:hypothetical protein